MNLQELKNLLDRANREKAAQDLMSLGASLAAKKLWGDEADREVTEDDMTFMFMSGQILATRETNLLLRAIIEILAGFAAHGFPPAPAADSPPDGAIMVPLSDIPDDVKDLFKGFGLDLDALFEDTPEPANG